MKKNIHVQLCVDSSFVLQTHEFYEEFCDSLLIIIILLFINYYCLSPTAVHKNWRKGTSFFGPSLWSVM